MQEKFVLDNSLHCIDAFIEADIETVITASGGIQAWTTNGVRRHGARLLC
jgi:hypothetical protein